MVAETHFIADANTAISEARDAINRRMRAVETDWRFSPEFKRSCQSELTARMRRLGKIEELRDRARTGDPQCVHALRTMAGIIRRTAGNIPPNSQGMLYCPVCGVSERETAVNHA